MSERERTTDYEFTVAGRAVSAVRDDSPRRRYVLQGMPRATRIQLWNGDPRDDGARLAEIARELMEVETHEIL